MLDDFLLINHNFKDLPYLNIYPLGDVHIGSRECDLNLFKQWIKMVESDEYGYAVIIGDILDAVALEPVYALRV